MVYILLVFNFMNTYRHKNYGHPSIVLLKFIIAFLIGIVCYISLITRLGKVTQLRSRS